MDKKYVDINAADFKKHLLSFDKTIKKQTSADHFMIVKIANYIKKVLLLRPPADVQEVRYGRWVCTDIIGVIKCSECKRTFSSELVDYDYCPNCGCKMSGGQNDKT